jgi:hypothetical protein
MTVEVEVKVKEDLELEVEVEVEIEMEVWVEVEEGDSWRWGWRKKWSQRLLIHVLCLHRGSTWKLRTISTSTLGRMRTE